VAPRLRLPDKQMLRPIRTEPDSSVLASRLRGHKLATPPLHARRSSPTLVGTSALGGVIKLPKDGAAPSLIPFNREPYAVWGLGRACLSRLSRKRSSATGRTLRVLLFTPCRLEHTLFRRYVWDVAPLEAGRIIELRIGDQQLSWCDRLVEQTR
jgi:hypothetical protein